MVVQVHTCVSVHCGQCGDSLGSPGFEAHYPTEHAARAAAAREGWLLGPGGWWCSACGPVLVCEAEGHQFSEWQPSAGRAGGAYRVCRRCCRHESHRSTPPSGVALAVVLTAGLDLVGGGVG